MFSLLLIGFAMGNPYDALVMDEAWKEELTFDFDRLDHVANFRNWAKTFDQHYDGILEEAAAFKIFMQNWQTINDFNLANDHSYTLRMNQFGAMTTDEFKLYVHGHADSCVRPRTVDERIKLKPVIPQTAAPDSIDWTDVDGKSYVTAVKNQGSCGSCWAFSTTGSIESRTAIALGVTGTEIETLSEQQLVDCSRSEGNMGCEGGIMDDAFKYVEKAGGLCSESEYPYKGKDGTCEASSCSKTYYPISSYTDVKADNEDALMSAVAEGPVSIAIEADQSAFQFYSSGVLDGKCGTRLDHGVLVVGYGEQDNQKFWKVKNSWGETWGEKGYVLICRDCDKNNGKGECGILEEPSFPIAKE